MSATAAQNPGDVAESVEGGRSDHRGWRLTVYFALLVAVVAVAAAAATVYVFVQTDRDSRNAARANATFAAHAAAKDLADGAATLHATTASLAQTPNIDAAATDPNCRLTFGSTGGLSDGHVDILKSDGSVSCSSRPHTGKAPLEGYGGAAWLKDVTKQPTLIGPVVDKVTGNQSLISAALTPGHGYAATFVALGPVGRSLVDIYGGGHAVEFLLTSADGKTILTRSVAPERWIGKPVAGTPFASGAGVERDDVDGTPRLYEQASVPGVGTFYAGEDEAAALAAGHRLRERQLIIILAGLALVLLATIFVYRRVAVPIRRLGTHVRKTSALSPPEPVPVSGPGRGGRSRARTSTG